MIVDILIIFLTIKSKAFINFHHCLYIIKFPPFLLNIFNLYKLNTLSSESSLLYPSSEFSPNRSFFSTIEQINSIIQSE